MITSTRWLAARLGIGVTAAAVATLGLTMPAAEAAVPCTTAGGTTTCTFSYTGAPETWTVPADVPAGTPATFALDGADGGRANYQSGNAGLGGHVGFVTAINPGDQIVVSVGGRGANAGAGGAGGGGAGARSGSGNGIIGGGGGGATRVNVAGQTVAVAGGGGGAGGAGNGLVMVGGDGGNADQSGTFGSMGRGTRGLNGAGDGGDGGVFGQSGGAGTPSTSGTSGGRGGTGQNGRPGTNGGGNGGFGSGGGGAGGVTGAFAGWGGNGFAGGGGTDGGGGGGGAGGEGALGSGTFQIGFGGDGGGGQASGGDGGRSTAPAGASVTTAANGGRAGSGQVTITFAAQQDQTITFPAIGDHVYGNADFDPGATASSGLPVSYASSTPGVCSIVADKVHVLAAGTCTITASQAGNTAYSAAQPVTQDATIAKAPVTITSRETQKLFATTFTVEVHSAVTGAGVSGAPVTVNATQSLFGAKASCTGTTGSTGTATCTINSLLPLRAGYRVTVGSTANYLGGTTG
ncbi:MAG: hypothetical protein ACJ72D_07185 [Marmoricola sp.]